MKITDKLIILFFVSTSVLQSCRSADTADTQTVAEPVIDVQVAAAAKGSISRKIVFYGETAAKEASIISSQFAGRLKDFALYESDRIETGQLIASVVNEQAEALLQGTKNITSFDRDNFVKNEIKETAIFSPITGVIVEKYKNNGDVIQKGDPILKVLDLSELYLWGSLPSIYMNEVKPGQDARISFEDIPGRVFNEKIGAFKGEVNPDNKTLKIRIDMSNPGNLLRSGMFARIEAVTQRKKAALLVPRSAVLTHNNEKIVFTAENGRAHRKTVTVGLETDSQSEIVTGIHEGDAVIILGNFEVEDGMKLRIRNE